MEIFGINFCIWNGNNFINLAWFILPCVVWNCLCHLGVLAFNSRIFDLACVWFGTFAVFSSRGSPISGTCKFYPPSWENPSCGIELSSEENPINSVRFTVAFVWEKSHQWSHDLETLRGENPYSRVGPPSGKNPSKRVWKLIGLRVGKIPQRKDDAHTNMQWCNLN